MVVHSDALIYMYGEQTSVIAKREYDYCSNYKINTVILELVILFDFDLHIEI